jgi:pimeloyl-ACP methyl ester carboxylesterase
MRERAVIFGRTTELVGVVTEPPAAQRHPDRPGIILLNAGLLHRVGASRLHVHLARALAPAGFSVLRFDLAGIGDSEPRRQSTSFMQSAIADTQEAMDYLAASGHRDFVLMGLCSGSDTAFETAKRDERVVGLVQLDAYAYRNLKWYINHYGPRLIKARHWSGYVNRQARAAFGLAVPGTAADEVISPYARTFPPKHEVQRDLAALVERGVRFFNIFSGGQQEHYNYARQHEDTFATIDFRDQLRVAYLPSADHVFTGLAEQRAVVNAVTHWMSDWTRRRTAPRIAAAS